MPYRQLGATSKVSARCPFPDVANTEDRSLDLNYLTPRSSSTLNMTSDTMPGTIPPRTSSHNAVNGANLANSTQRMSRPLMTEEEWISQKKSRRASNTVGSPLSPTDTAQANEILQQPAHWSREKEKILLGPYDYMLGHPGKDIRSQLINSFNVWLKVPEHSLAIITRVVGMLHTSSLLVDDVEDNSLLRRGVPVAHSIFGTAQTINSANYVYFVALQELLKLNNPELIRIYTEELLNLHRGQGMDLFWRDTLTCPSEDDYLEMVGNKTGGLFRLAVKLMQAESQSKIDCVPLVNSIGLIFQILDDYKNLSDDTYTANKGLCEDLTEGKFSFPVIHSIRTEPENLVLINILKQKTRDDEVKRYAMAYMEKTGSFSYTRKILRGLTKRALALLDEMEEGRDKAEGIRGLLEKMRVEEPVNGHSKNGS